MENGHTSSIDDVPFPEARKILKEADEAAGFNSGIIARYFGESILSRPTFGIKIEGGAWAYEKDGNTKCKGTSIHAIWAWDLDRPGKYASYLDGPGWRWSLVNQHASNVFYFDASIRVSHQKDGDKTQPDGGGVYVYGRAPQHEKNKHRIWYSTHGFVDRWKEYDVSTVSDAVRRIEDIQRVIAIDAKVRALLPEDKR